jgi:hypothetical protein
VARFARVAGTAEIANATTLLTDPCAVTDKAVIGAGVAGTAGIAMVTTILTDPCAVTDEPGIVAGVAGTAGLVGSATVFTVRANTDLEAYASERVAAVP